MFVQTVPPEEAEGTVKELYGFSDAGIQDIALTVGRPFGETGGGEGSR